MPPSPSPLLLTEKCPECRGTRERPVAVVDRDWGDPTHRPCSRCSSRGWVVSEEAVEVAASVAWTTAGNPMVFDRWENIEEIEREPWRRIARSALEAVASMNQEET